MYVSMYIRIFLPRAHRACLRYSGLIQDAMEDPLSGFEIFIK